MGRQVLQLEQRLLAEVNIEEMHSYTQGAPTVQSIPRTLVDNILYCIIWWLFPYFVFTLLEKILFSYKKKSLPFQDPVCPNLACISTFLIIWNKSLS